MAVLSHGQMSTKAILTDRQMGESVSCAFETKDLQDTIWPHLVVSVLRISVLLCSYHLPIPQDFIDAVLDRGFRKSWDSTLGRVSNKDLQFMLETLQSRTGSLDGKDDDTLPTDR
jgi:hypothetical protein